VAEPPYFPGSFWDGGASAKIYETLAKDARERAHAAVDKAAATLQAEEGSRALNVTKTIPSGPAKDAILDEAEAFGADLIVVGSHGHGKFERFLLGSVAHAVALHAKCSVEIVRCPKAPAIKSKSPG
jgi:nucleotide-binding universal stress UspA family protein